MKSYHLVKGNGFFILIFICVYVLNLIFTWSLGQRNFRYNDKSTHLVYLNPLLSIILFLYIYHRKVNLWFVIAQIVNILIFVSGIVSYNVFKINTSISFIIISILFLLDLFVFGFIAVFDSWKGLGNRNSDM